MKKNFFKVALGKKWLEKCLGSNDGKWRRLCNLRIYTSPETELVLDNCFLNEYRNSCSRLPAPCSWFSVTAVLKLEHASRFPGGPDKTQISGPQPQSALTQEVCVIYIANRFQQKLSPLLHRVGPHLGPCCSNTRALTALLFTILVLSLASFVLPLYSLPPFSIVDLHIQSCTNHLQSILSHLILVKPHWGKDYCTYFID